MSTALTEPKVRNHIVSTAFRKAAPNSVEWQLAKSLLPVQEKRTIHQTQVCVPE